MGYCIRVNCKVKIPLANEAKAIEIFKNLDAKVSFHGGGSVYSNGKETKHYAWVNSGFSDLSSLQAMFEEWRYEGKKRKDYLVILSFTGQKLGDDEKLWKALAPVVSEDSVLEFLGEDGARWQYTFKNNKFLESYLESFNEDEEEN